MEKVNNNLAINEIDFGLPEWEEDVRRLLVEYPEMTHDDLTEWFGSRPGYFPEHTELKRAIEDAKKARTDEKIK